MDRTRVTRPHSRQISSQEYLIIGHFRVVRPVLFNLECDPELRPSFELFSNNDTHSSNSPKFDTLNSKEDKEPKNKYKQKGVCALPCPASTCYHFNLYFRLRRREGGRVLLRASTSNYVSLKG